MKIHLVAAIALASLFTLTNHAAPPELTLKDLPRIPPVETSNVFKTFQIKPGFSLHLAAAEPLVLDPIEISFDENGRMFVVEMRDYSEMRDVKPHMGRIRLVSDSNGDGVFDKATVYAEDLPWPTGVCCYDGGIFVAASPDIIYFKDTDGDGKADIRKVVFTGFGAGKGDKLNVQALVNGLRWGMDNRIHGQTAGNGGVLKRPDAPDSSAIDLRGRDFSFDPRKLDLSTENGGGQYGMCYDNHGRKFVCSNSHHIQTFMYEAHYGERNSIYNMPSSIVDIPVDGPAAEVYRTSPEEAWRVIRTKWRVTGVVQGLIEGGGRASGYFTSATGITVYRGDAFPEEFLGDAFIADVGSNLIHRKKVRSAGVELIAERPVDEQKVEFITSTDLWFRPVQLANAPDGCLYFCDMYREVIEHPWSLPENIKKLLDLNAGNDRGRIYRITPDGYKTRKPPKLGKATTKQLVATLENKNGWHRDTAARLLFERQDKAAIPLLQKMILKSPSALARLHALHVLDGLGLLKGDDLLAALDDSDAFVREHAIQLSEKFIAAGDAALWTKICQLSNDPDINVRYQLAFTLGEFNRPGKLDALVAIARRDSDSKWTQSAIYSSLADGSGEMFTTLAADANVRRSQSGQEMLRQLIVFVGAKNRPEEVATALKFMSQVNDPATAFTMTRALGEGLKRANKPLTSAGESLKGVLARAQTEAANPAASESVRVVAVQLLVDTSYEDSGKLLLGLLDLQHPQPVQLAALATLEHFTSAPIGPELTSRWNTLTPRLRASALTILVSRPDRARALLQAIEAGTIRASVLDSTQTKLLSTYRDPKVRQLALKVLAAQPASPRKEIINTFTPALSLAGDAAAGKKIYAERCVSCHRSSGEGFALGPDFVTVKTTGKEKLLTNIIDPNAEVRPEFVSYVVETKDDQSLLGLVVNETSSNVTLRQAYGKQDVIPRSNITKMQSQGQSVMPEGLEAGLTPQAMADLLEYISTATQ
ncbi:MAG: c-type cytochrome [Verrucomicrobia bacterium]|nr:c-type cytochrome [Verrucomicrobiota bacterium]